MFIIFPFDWFKNYIVILTLAQILGDFLVVLLLLVSNLIPPGQRCTWNCFSPCKFVETYYEQYIINFEKFSTSSWEKCVFSSCWGWCCIRWWDQNFKILLFKAFLSLLLILASLISYWMQCVKIYYFAYIFHILAYDVQKSFWWMDYLITIKYLIFFFF